MTAACVYNRILQFCHVMFNSDARNCEDVYARGMVYNGTYPVYNDDGTSYEVFCQFNPDRSGLAFPTKNATSSRLVNLDALWMNRTYVGIYLWFAGGNQYEALIRPLANEESITQLTVGTSWQTRLLSADNSAGPYIYFTLGDGHLTAASPCSTVESGKRRQIQGGPKNRTIFESM